MRLSIMGTPFECGPSVDSTTVQECGPNGGAHGTLLRSRQRAHVTEEVRISLCGDDVERLRWLKAGGPMGALVDVVTGVQDLYLELHMAGVSNDTQFLGGRFSYCEPSSGFVRI